MIKKILTEIYWFFYFLVRPRWWQQNNSISKIWDCKLNKLMDTEEPKNYGRHIVKLGGYTIWIANYPYAYGSNYNDGSERLPKRRTRLRLMRFLEESLYR